MNKIGTFMDRLSKSLVTLNTGLLIAALGILSLSVLVQVFVRVVFSATFVMLSDVIAYSFPISVFTGAALLFNEDGNIVITFFTDFFKPKAQKLILGIASVITMVTLTLLVIKGFEFAFNGLHQFSPSLGIKLIYIFMVVPLFAVSSLVFVINNILKN